ncbi:MAG: amidohydrolase family protein [Nitrososphaerales archaeon]
MAQGSSDEKNRYRHIRAGLDNAVKQAEERKLDELFIVDADCHQREPFELIARYMNSPFREMLLKPDEEDDSFLSRHNRGVDGKYFHSKTRNGRRIRSEVSFPKPQPPEELIEVFTKRMYDLGIKRSIIFPTPLMYLAMDPNHEFEVSATNAYIDFMLEHFLGKYKEMLSPVCLPVNSPDKAAELIDRVGKEKGVIGAMVPSTSPTLAGNKKWDPIYEAAESKSLTICMHSNTYSGGFFSDFDKFIGLHTLCRPVTLATQLTSIVLNGVPERFKKLKFVFVEGGVSWIPWIMQRMDSEYILRRDEAPILTKMPSDYVREFYFTSQPLEYANEEDLEYAFNKIGAENHLMYASDYPHWDFDVPSTIYDLSFLSLKAKKNILGETAKRVFKIN